MPITPFSSPPQPTDSPAEFNSKAFDLLGALPTFVSEANALESNVNAKEATASGAASTATTQAGIATTQAGIATTKAGEATTQAGIATTQAGIATTAAASLGSLPATTGNANKPVFVNASGDALEYKTASAARTVLGATSTGDAIFTASSVSAARSAIGVGIRGHIAGLTMSTAGSSSTITIASGESSDSTNSVLIMLADSINKTTSAWAVGSGNGGLDTGTIANNTGYHFYLILRPDTGVVDVIFSTNATLPTLPANYTHYRRIGWAKTNGSAQWIAFIQDGEYFEWLAPPLDVTTVGAAGTAAVLRTITTPGGINCRVLLGMQMAAGGSGELIYVSDPAVSDQVPLSGASSPLNSMICAPGGTSSAHVWARTNTFSQVRTRQLFGTASETLRIVTVAWIDARGRNA